MKTKIFCLIAAFSFSSAVTGMTAPTFSKDIRPIFKAKCTKCHGFIAQKKLKLTSLKNVMKGGESGAVIVPGAPDKSILYKQFSLPKTDVKRMPPATENNDLTAAEKATIKAWIEAGAK